ncbi:hypothetical protein A3Q56_02439, partial [Intoshia linei]
WIKSFKEKALQPFNVFFGCSVKSGTNESINESIKCLKAYMNNWVGIKSISDHEEIIKNLVSLFYMHNSTDCIIVIDISRLLAAVCRYSENGLHLVLKCITEIAAEEKKPRFKPIVYWLFHKTENDDEQLHLNMFIFLTSILHSIKSVDYRHYLRSEMLAAGFRDFVRLKIGQKDISMEFRGLIDTFNLMEKDDNELILHQFNVSIENFSTIKKCNYVLEHLFDKDTISQSLLVNILQQFIYLPNDATSRCTTLCLIENCIHQIIFGLKHTNVIYSEDNLSVQLNFDQHKNTTKLKETYNKLINSKNELESLKKRISDQEECCNQKSAKIEALEKIKCQYEQQLFTSGKGKCVVSTDISSQNKPSTSKPPAISAPPVNIPPPINAPPCGAPPSNSASSIHPPKNSNFQLAKTISLPFNMKPKINYKSKADALNTYRVFWNKINVQTLESKSIWVNMDDKYVFSEDMVDSVRSVFAKRKLSKPDFKATKELSDKSVNGMGILDDAILQNLGVAIRQMKMKNITSEIFVKQILQGDKHNSLNMGPLSTILKYFPDEKCLKKLRDNESSYNKMNESEQLIYHLSKIPHSKSTIESLILKHTFWESVTILKSNFSLINTAISEICNSNKLKEFFNYILSIGNLLNTGTTHWGAFGFHIEDLPRICSNDINGKPYVRCILEIADSKKSKMGELIDELKISSEIKVDYNLLKQDFTSLSISLAKCSKHLQKLETEVHNDKGYFETMTKFMSDTKVEIETVRVLLDKVDSNYDYASQYFSFEKSSVPINSFFLYFSQFLSLFKISLSRHNTEKREIKRIAMMQRMRKYDSKNWQKKRYSTPGIVDDGMKCQNAVDTILADSIISDQVYNEKDNRHHNLIKFLSSGTQDVNNILSRTPRCSKNPKNIKHRSVTAIPSKFPY